MEWQAGAYHEVRTIGLKKSREKSTQKYTCRQQDWKAQEGDKNKEEEWISKCICSSIKSDGIII